MDSRVLKALPRGSKVVTTTRVPAIFRSGLVAVDVGTILFLSYKSNGYWDRDFTNGGRVWRRQAQVNINDAATSVMISVTAVEVLEVAGGR